MSTLSQFSGGRIKSVQRGTIAISFTTSATETITAVDPLKTMINYLGETTVFNDIRTNARISLTNSTTITATRFDDTGTTTVSYEVIEFY